MSVGPNQRGEHRVAFSQGVPVQILAIDGTWSRSCLMMDASDHGAKLTLTQSVETLQLREFFLKLSTTGAASRLCELVWMNGDQIGVRFVEKLDSEEGAQQ